MLMPMDEHGGGDRQTFDDVLKLVRRGASEACADNDCPIAPILERCVEQAVTSRWSSPIRIYVPLLALREVRECCRRGACPDIAPVGRM